MWSHDDDIDEDELFHSAPANGLGWLALGAAAMYYLDPRSGRRRRALLRDKLLSTAHHTAVRLRRTADYSRQRTWGMMAETRACFAHEAVDDATLAERVRSAMGRVVSHPRAIQVFANDRVVTLRGPVLAHEVDELLRTIRRVRGVREVVDHLDVHKRPGDNPALQGGTARTGRRRGLRSEYWDPFTRLIATAGGAGLSIGGLARRDLFGLLMACAGTALAARALTNLSARRLTGIGAARRAIDVQKTITIGAPADAVFGFFANYDNFPRFMSNVREVRDHDSGRSHWVVAGPMGMNLSWDADLTDYVPNRLIAWRSVPGATVENAGIMRFEETADGGATRVDIKLSYNPPAGAIGHFLAKLFGADPKSEMDADLARVKTAIETGHLPRDAARPIRHAEALMPRSAPLM